MMIPRLTVGQGYTHTGSGTWVIGHGRAPPGSARTGGIANGMAPRIQAASGAELAAVSSRRMETAREFADRHGAGNAFDSWQKMIDWDGIDAIYIATPTSVRASERTQAWLVAVWNSALANEAKEGA